MTDNKSNKSLKYPIMSCVAAVVIYTTAHILAVLLFPSTHMTMTVVFLVIIWAFYLGHGGYKLWKYKRELRVLLPELYASIIESGGDPVIRGAVLMMVAEEETKTE